MPAKLQRVTPFLWFDDQAEEAVRVYTRVFPNSRVLRTTRYVEEAARAAGRPVGSVMTIAFELDGQEFAAINGGGIGRISGILATSSGKGLSVKSPKGSLGRL
jgi:predicted 3-demethylubiquinone-9 3-methyltransferase (glyoxalase superfamily)